MIKSPYRHLGDGYTDTLDFARVNEIFDLALEYMESERTTGFPPKGEISSLELYIWEKLTLMYRLGSGDLPNH